MKSSDAYGILERRFARIAHLHAAGAMLHWDAASLMPSGGAAARADQLAALTATSHEMVTAPELRDLLQKVAARPGDLSRWQRANLREMQRQYEDAVAVPTDLLVAWGKAGAACEMVWRQARADDNFKVLIKPLSKVIALTRQVARAKAEKHGLSDYDALLNQFEPGLRQDRLTPIFAQLEAELPPLLDAAIAASNNLGKPLTLGKPAAGYAVEKQQALARLLMTKVGFDFNHGRLDESLHPFTGGVPDDVRLTTRYDAKNFIPALMGVLHETGHAMYERGLPPRWRDQPVGQAMGMAIHESQSLIVEMQAGRCNEFINYYARTVRRVFAGKGRPWAVTNFRRQLHRVGRGLIRVDADEVSYSLHVILRYGLERALISGDLSLPDLPGAWNDGMARLVGVTPKDDRDGCLQDIHWMDGAFGYFPTYTLGAIAAAQLYQAACIAEPTIPEGLKSGDFSPLMHWLAKNIHNKARYYPDSETLLRRATGQSYDVDGYLNHLRQRYLP